MDPKTTHYALIATRPPKPILLLVLSFTIYEPRAIKIASIIHSRHRLGTGVAGNEKPVPGQMKSQRTHNTCRTSTKHSPAFLPNINNHKAPIKTT